MKFLLATLAAVLLLALVFWRPWEKAPQPPAPPPVSGSSGLSPADDPIPSPRPAVPPPASAATPAPSAMTPEEIQRVRDAIDNLEFVFRDHAAALGGNPVGTNAEITAALLGDNAKQLKLELPGDSTVNAAGELCDPWGTPWFFHQLGRTRMEIRSAGADKALYTDDDFVR